MSNHQQQSQSQRQRQNMYMVHQKLQLLHMMHLSAVALEEYVKIQLEENPALELSVEANEKQDELLTEADRQEHESRTMDDLETYYDDDDYPEYKTYINNTTADTDWYSSPSISEKSFRDSLKEQISVLNLSEESYQHASYLIDSLEEDGYLRRSLQDLADDYGFSVGKSVDESKLEESLMIIHGLEPPGSGARSLQECLILQLLKKDPENPDVKMALILLRDCFSELSTKSFDKIIAHLNVGEDKLKEILSIITHLSPHPVFAVNKTETQAMSIIPEFIVQLADDSLEVSLANNPSFTLKISDQYVQQANAKTKPEIKSKRKDTSYLKRKLEEAKWFIDAIQQREKTFLDIIKAIAVRQKDFFMTGDQRQLKPMILQDITDVTGHDLSTISRVTSNKYVQTPYGNYLLKKLFSNSLTNDTGQEVSVREIKEELKEIILQEDKLNPCNDHEIVNKLLEKGFIIARRTVVKYREAMSIPNARMRKELKT